MRTVDLHTHSDHSDGTVCPAGLVAMAEAAGLSAVALCDHNTLAGLPEFLRAGEGSCVETVCGIELSTDHGDSELHILGLFIRPEHCNPINQWLDEALHRKEASNLALVQALNRAGIPLDYAQLKEHTAGGFVNRAVIAAELTAMGITASVQDAFCRYLHPCHGLYVPPKRPDTCQTIQFLREIGAVSVLAHPFLDLDEDGLAAFLPQAVAAGLDGMETMYPKFTPLQTAAARQLAMRFGLAESGGSDFHGQTKPETCLGTGICGNLAVPEEFLRNLRSKARKYAEKHSNL